jgi:transposase
MSHEIRADYSQMWMFPPSLEDLVAQDHPVRFIREFVDALDLEALGFRMRKGEEGRPNYGPDLLLKIWVYGYLERIYSTRGLEKACRQHLGLLWLTWMNTPDHRTIWRFWRDNQDLLKEVFRKTVRVGVDAGLVDMVLHAVDGTKITARASTDKAWMRKKLEKQLEKLDKSIDQAMAEVEKAENDLSGEYRLPEELAKKGNLRETIREKLEKLDAEGRDHMHPGEPEAEMMKNHEGTRLGYNAQAVVDSKAGLIVAGEVRTDQNDSQQLVPMLERVQEELGRVAEETVADGGYCTGEQLDKAEQSQFPVLVNLGQLRKSEEEGGPYHSSQFEYDEENDCYLCPRGQKLEFERKQKHVDKHYETKIYHCKHANQCPVRGECSQDKRGRHLERSPYTDAVLRQKQKQQDENKSALLRKRMVIVEPVFSRVKHLLQFRRWTMGGLDKVKAQWMFICALLNLMRIYPLWREGKLQLS